MNDNARLSAQLRRLENEKSVTGQRQFNLQQDEVRQVQIRPDSTVSLGHFRPDPLVPGALKAHPQTIRALRTEIFVAGHDLFDSLEFLHICEGCHKEIDLQFWHFCPFCEKMFRPEHIKRP